MSDVVITKCIVLMHWCSCRVAVGVRRIAVAVTTHHHQSTVTATPYTAACVYFIFLSLSVFAWLSERDGRFIHNESNMLYFVFE